MNEDRFDSDLPLDGLLPQALRQHLHGALEGLLGTAFCLRDARGAPLSGENPIAGKRIPLVLELEPIGYLEATNVDPSRLLAAKALLELQLKSAARYQMASRLHLEAVYADYEALQVKHFALQQSEVSLRALSATLEQRVQEQVETIEEAQRRLYQAEKMASVGQLAAGVAHEINNPLGFIRSNLNSAGGYLRKLERLGPLVEARDVQGLAVAWQQEQLDEVLQDFAALLQESIAGVDRVARIVADLKSYSSLDRAEVENVDLNECIRSVCNMARMHASGQANIELELAELPRLYCSAAHIRQALMNLLLNALWAVGAGGRIVVRSKCANEEAIISVIDHGVGIPPEVLPRIFDPFFTTHEVGQGTGLGLTVCRDIIAAHRGRIEVQSQPGRGSSFTIHLPLSAQS